MPNEKPSKSRKEEIQPLTSKERANWNRFLRFVNEKGYTGDKTLDNRDRSLGLSLLKQYNDQAGDNVVPEDMIPRVQQEFNYYKDNGYFPGEEGKDFGNFRNIISSQVRDTVSPVDNWFGSLTSQQAYPVIIDNNRKNWGTDYDGFLEYFKNKFASR